jgi:hypothetical protein
MGLSAHFRLLEIARERVHHADALAQRSASLQDVVRLPRETIVRVQWRHSAVFGPNFRHFILRVRSCTPYVAFVDNP